MNEYGYNDNTEVTVSVKEWLITFLILCIPTVNIIMMIVWAFGGGASPTKANLFKASLIMTVIFTVITVIFVLICILVPSMIGIAEMGNY